MKLTSLFTSPQIDILADLHERDSRERQEGIREESSLKALAPAVAQLLYLLIVRKSAKTIVEFGTSHGYSTIHLAAGADRTDGRVYTVDMIPEKTTSARDNLAAADLLHRVTLATCDGAAFATSLPESIDFVLVDYGIPAFAPAWDALRGKTEPGCLIFFDGGPKGYWESGAAMGFKALLEDDPAFIVSILPMEKDQLIGVRIAE